MDSTTTTALGTITGSWRPRMAMVVFFPLRVMVLCSLEMEGVGFMAALRMIRLPSLIPPRIPPA